MAASDTELLAAFPDTLVNHDNKEFYRGWLDKRLMMNRCSDCGTWHHPPQARCPECWSTAVVPTAIAGKGTVYMLIRLHQGPPAPGVDYRTPHPVATVELVEQEGLRFSSTIVNCPPDQMRIGMPVQLTWIERHGAPYPVFEPAS